MHAKCSLDDLLGLGLRLDDDDTIDTGRREASGWVFEMILEVSQSVRSSLV